MLPVLKNQGHIVLPLSVHLSIRENHLVLSMIQAAVVYKPYHPWSCSSTSSIILNHGRSKSPYDSCTHSTAEPQPVQPVSSFRQKEKKTKKETSKSCVGSRMDRGKNEVWTWGLVHKSSRSFTIRVRGGRLGLAFFTFQGLNE